MFNYKSVAEGLISIGFVSLVFGIGGAIAEVLQGGLHRNLRLDATFEAWGIKEAPVWLQATLNFAQSAIEALIDLIVVIRTSPLWLGLTIIGIILIFLGSYLMPDQKETKKTTPI
jgi:uncharacterized membrane protein